MTKEFWSSDLYFSAYLKASGLVLIKTPSENGRTSFVFDADSGDVSQLTQKWLDRTGQVSGREYAMEVKLLKNLVHQ